MKKFNAILLSLLTLSVFVIIGWLLYKNYPTTPVVIINLVLIMAGVLLAYTVYHRFYTDSITNYYDYKESHFPEPEGALIYAMPDDFCNKIEFNKGSVFITGMDEILKDIKLTKAEYDKLLDEVNIEFNNGVSLKVNGISTIAVGDEQFMFYGFNKMEYKSKSDHIFLIWDSSQLNLKKNGEDFVVRMPDGEPTFAFDWSESIDEED